MALMCTPEARSGPWRTGCDAVVAVQIMSAPRAASEEELAGSTGTPIRCDISSANCLRRSALRPYTRGGEGLRTAGKAPSWLLGLTPGPIMGGSGAHRGTRAFGGTPG